MIYYCKNCKYGVGIHNSFFSSNCFLYPSKNYSITYIDCVNCNKFVGILCKDVCINCLGEEVFFKKEENLIEWIFKYKKTLNIESFKKVCKICNQRNYRHQSWFFEELTFYKQ